MSSQSRMRSLRTPVASSATHVAETVSRHCSPRGFAAAAARMARAFWRR